jgi:glutathione synthase/RimK-type ligase-like ATP-grasp enzyme
MILLWGILGDEPMDLVREALDRQKQRYVFLDQQAVARTSLELKVGKTVRGRLKSGDWILDLESVDAIYLRPYDTRRMRAVQRARTGSAVWRHALTLDEGLLAWVETTPVLVLNRPSAMASNNSKPYQTSLIEAAGLRVPETLVTTDAEAAIQFWERHGHIIYKSLSGVRSIVSRITPEHRSRLAEIANCPTQFQQFVPGNDWRVHVVGKELFACEIVSAADDYRYAARSGDSVQFLPRELPDELGRGCFRVSEALRLPLCGIDLRRTPQGEWFCFEVNPSPGYSFYESATGHRISESISHFLSSAGREFF